MATKEKPKYETPGILQDAPGALAKTATALGVGFAPLVDAINASKQYLVGGVRQPQYFEPNMKAFENAWGMGAKPPVVAPKVVVPTRQAPQVAPPTQQAVATPANANPIDKYSNIYDALKDLPNDKFKRYVDEYGDTTPGIGYVEINKDKNGKMLPKKDWKIERIIENPANRPQEPMTLAEAEVTAKLVGGIGAREEAKAARAQADETKRLGIQSQDEDRKARAEEKASTNFSKKLFALSPQAPNNITGEATPNWKVGLLDMIDEGVDPESMTGFSDIAKSLTKKREKWIADQFPKLKAKYNPADINKPGTETYKHRTNLLQVYRTGTLNPTGAK